MARQWDEQALAAAACHEHDARVRCRLLALRQLALGRTVAQTAGPFMLGPSQLYHWTGASMPRGWRG